MPCYVRFKSIEQLLQEGIIRESSDPYFDDEVRDSITTPMLPVFDGGYYRTLAPRYSERFCIDAFSYNFYKNWVAEWSLDGIHPVREEPTAKKKPTAPPAPTRTIKLIAVPATERSCGLCFYQGFKCFTSECNRRYWSLVETVDN